MKVVVGLLTAVVLSGISFSARAQVPQGSYLHSCNHIRMEGPTLTAVCRRADGRENRTALGEVNRCVGDIANNNGVLQCNRGPGPPPGYVQAPMPGQLMAPGYPPPASVQAPHWREEQEHQYREHCERLGEADRDIRARLAYTPPSEERERLEYRLHEIHRERERCWGH